MHSCNAYVRVCGVCVQCMYAQHCVRGLCVGSRIVGCMFALLALFKGKRMKPKQYHFNVYSKVVCTIFHNQSNTTHVCACLSDTIIPSEAAILKHTSTCLQLCNTYPSAS